MIGPLPEREYLRRRERLAGILWRVGDLTVEDREEADTRTLRLAVDAPGEGLPREAMFEFREWFTRGRDRWGLIGYGYEYREHPRPGRRAYHWHGGDFHMHCVDPRLPSRDHHYRGSAVTAFEALDEFLAIFYRGESVSCADLRPARPAP